MQMVAQRDQCSVDTPPHIRVFHLLPPHPCPCCCCNPASSAARSNLDQAYDRLQLLRSEEARTASELDAATASSSSRAAEQASLAAATAELERRAAEAARLAAEQADKEGRARKALEKLQRQLRGAGSRPGSSAGAAASSSSSGESGEVEGVLQRLLGDSGSGAAEEQDVALAELRTCSRQMLVELKSLAAAAPGEEWGAARACRQCMVWRHERHTQWHTHRWFAGM
jgi:hypothetical protein